jgi:hypothetical protein
MNMTDKAISKFASIVAEADARTPVAWLGSTLKKATVWLTEGGSICLRSGNNVLALTPDSLMTLSCVLIMLDRPGRLAALESVLDTAERAADVETATGSTLDWFGASIGIPRGVAETDADYRERLAGVPVGSPLDAARAMLLASGMEYLSDGLWGWVDSTAVAHVDGGVVEFRGDYSYTPAQLRALADLAELGAP